MSSWANAKSTRGTAFESCSRDAFLVRLAALALMAAIVLGFAGCATTPPIPRPDGAQHYYRGRIAIHYGDPGAPSPQGLFGQFEWIERDGAIEVTLSNPLGQAVARVTSNAEAASLVLADGRRFDGATPEDLTRSALGFVLPVRGMASWLAGEPWHRLAADVQTDEDGAKTIREDGWTVQYAAPSAQGQRVSKMHMNYPGPDIEVDIRLVLDQEGDS